jgi:hypothetical protein
MSKSNKGKCLLKWITKCEKTSAQKGMVGFLIKKGMAKSKSMANVELIFIAILFFAMSKIIFVVI